MDDSIHQIVGEARDLIVGIGGGCERVGAGIVGMLSYETSRVSDLSRKCRRRPTPRWKTCGVAPHAGVAGGCDMVKWIGDAEYVSSGIVLHARGECRAIGIAPALNCGHVAPGVVVEPIRSLRNLIVTAVVNSLAWRFCIAVSTAVISFA